MDKLDLNARAREIESITREILEPLLETGRLAEIRGRGGMIGLEFVDAEGRPDMDVVKQIAQSAKDKGVLILTCGYDGNVIRLLPPLVISGNLLQEGLDVLAEAIRHNL